MFHDPNSCTFCGRFVLEVEGWAESVEPYHRILATWDDEATFFDGSYHFACLRSFDRRAEFRAELLSWICQTDHTIDIRGEDGQLHELPRIGLGYTAKIATIPSGEIYENNRFNRWVYAENDGPVHFLELDDVAALTRGTAVRGDQGGGKTLLPKDPGPVIAQWDLTELLDFLDIRDLYQDMLLPEYKFWRGSSKGSGYVLTYSLSCLRPIPADVGEFFVEYMSNYTPKRLEDA